MHLLSGIATARVQAEIMMSHKPPVFRNGHRREKLDTGVPAAKHGLAYFHAVADARKLVGELL
jgi:hypothetical protein